MDCIYLFALSFTAANQSGIALVGASTQQDAFRILKNAGRYNGMPDAYVLVQATRLGVYTENRYELLFESYTNAIVAYDAIVNTIQHLVTKEEFIEILGYTPADESDLYKKVDKEEGKGLSEENYTVEEKLKLASIDMSTVENIIETIKRNGVVLPVIDKSVNISVPTELSQLNTDATHRVVTDNEKAAWNDKYDKPSAGIPKSDLSDTVRESLNLADSAAEVIPNTASPENKLVDKNYVDSSISTASATFRGTSAQNLTELQFLAWANNLTHDLNDYVYWNTTDRSGNTVYKRYKFNGSTWIFEYDINNSSFSAAEWAAIQSGITDVLVTKLSNMPSVDTIDAKLARADDDHTRAETDHGIAVNDHTQAGSDHQQATQDHTLAEQDHTRAELDHSRAESDHSRAEEDHASIADKVSQEELAEAIEPLARKDGYYGGLTAGTAENLVGRGSVEAEYSGVRTSAGKEDIGSGSAQIVRLKGNSVKWNAILNSFSKYLSDNVATYSDNGRRIDVAWKGVEYYFQSNINEFDVVVGHKLYIVYTASNVVHTSGQALSGTVKDSSSNNLFLLVDRTKHSFDSGRLSHIQTALASGRTKYVLFSTGSGGNLNPNGDTISLSNFTVIDLTAIFGSGNEPETVEEFESWLAENVGVRDYYPYTEPTVINNAATGIRTRGYNLYNNATGKAYLPGTYSDYPHEYEICGTFTSISYTDINGKTYVPELTDGRFFNVDAPGELTVVGGNATDTLVHLVWSGWRNEGEPDYAYEPYWENLLPLNITTLTGKLNGEGNSVTIVPNGLAKVGDVADYGIVENGMLTKIVKCVGVVDMGGFSWDYNGVRFATNNYIPNVTQKAGRDKGVCQKYPTSQTSVSVAPDKSIIFGDGTDGTLYVKDSSFSLAADFKTAMSGVLLYYELATPQVYVLDTPIAMNYRVDDFGTEQAEPAYTNTLTAPIVYDVQYAMNAVDTIRRLPDNYVQRTDVKQVPGNSEKNVLSQKAVNENYARKTGTEDNLTVGAAKNIAGNATSGGYPFTFVRISGTDGLAKINEVRGKSLVWNQLENRTSLPATSTVNGVTITNNGDGSLTVNGTNDGSSSSVFHLGYISLVSGHKYVLYGSPKMRGWSDYALYLSGAGVNYLVGSAGKLYFTSGVTDRISLTLSIWANKSVDNDTFYPMVIDLTLMFGAGNEPATVEEFEALYPLPYYAYNAGQIISNKTEAVAVTGRNQWDEEWELGNINTDGEPTSSSERIRTKNFISVLGGASYYFKYPATTTQAHSIFQYDGSKNLIKRNTVSGPEVRTLEQNTAFIKIAFSSNYGTTYSNDICINLSDPSFNGQYEPYKKNTIELNLPTLTGKLNGEGESVEVFPEGMRGAGTAYDKAAGNRAEVVMAEADLGTLDYTFIAPTQDHPINWFRTTLPNKKIGQLNLVCGKYANIASASIDKTIYGQSSGTNINIMDSSFSDAATFKAAMSGVKLVYELAEPLVYELDEGVPETFQAYKGGTLKQLPENGSEPTTAPNAMSVTYAIDAAGILTGLPQDYISKESLTAMLASMQSAGLFASYTMTFNATTGKYEFTFTANS